MHELTETEIAQVSGGLGPLAIIGIDLALNGVLLAYANYAAGNFYRISPKYR